MANKFGLGYPMKFCVLYYMLILEWVTARNVALIRRSTFSLFNMLQKAIFPATCFATPLLDVLCEPLQHATPCAMAEVVAKRMQTSLPKVKFSSICHDLILVTQFKLLESLRPCNTSIATFLAMVLKDKLHENCLSKLQRAGL